MLSNLMNCISEYVSEAISNENGERGYYLDARTDLDSEIDSISNILNSLVNRVEQLEEK